MLTKKTSHPDSVVRCRQMMPQYLPCLANQRVVSLIENVFWHSQVQFIHFSEELKCLLDGDCKEESISLEMPFVQSQCQQLYNMMGTELWMDTQQHRRCKGGWIKVKVSWRRARTDEWLVESVFHNLTYVRKWELNVTKWYLPLQVAYQPKNGTTEKKKCLLEEWEVRGKM